MNSQQYEKLPKQKPTQYKSPVSECCGAPPLQPLDSDGYGLCSQCGEWCDKDEWYEQN